MAGLECIPTSYPGKESAVHMAGEYVFETKRLNERFDLEKAQVDARYSGWMNRHNEKKKIDGKFEKAAQGIASTYLGLVSARRDAVATTIMQRSAHVGGELSEQKQWMYYADPLMPELNRLEELKAGLEWAVERLGSGKKIKEKDIETIMEKGDHILRDRYGGPDAFW